MEENAKSISGKDEKMRKIREAGLRYKNKCDQLTKEVEELKGKESTKEQVRFVSNADQNINLIF